MSLEVVYYRHACAKFAELQPRPPHDRDVCSETLVQYLLASVCVSWWHGTARHGPHDTVAVLCDWEMTVLHRLHVWSVDVLLPRDTRCACVCVCVCATDRVLTALPHCNILPTYMRRHEILSDNWQKYVSLWDSFAILITLGHLAADQGAFSTRTRIFAQ